MAASRKKPAKAFTALELEEQLTALIEEAEAIVDADAPPYVRLKVLEAKLKLVLELKKARPIEEASDDPIQAIKLRAIG